MTRTEKIEAKAAQLWNENHRAFEQSCWFGSSYYQRHAESTQRKLDAYIAKHGLVRVVPNA